jgi:hypothetical protein
MTGTNFSDWYNQAAGAFAVSFDRIAAMFQHPLAADSQERCVSQIPPQLTFLFLAAIAALANSL